MAHPLQLSVPPGQPVIAWTRDFDFPPADVYGAFADPDLLSQWVGPRGTSVSISDYDFSTGGRWACTYPGADGPSSANGVFHTIRPQELIIQTFESSGAPDTVLLQFQVFEELPDGATRLRGHTVHTSQAARDAMASPAFARSMADGFERLEELLGSDSHNASVFTDQFAAVAPPVMPAPMPAAEEP